MPVPSYLQVRLIEPESRFAAQQLCFYWLLDRHPDKNAAVELQRHIAMGDRVHALLTHGPVQMLLAAEHLVDHLQRAVWPVMLRRSLPAALVFEAASLIQDDERVLKRLRRTLARRPYRFHAMAASLLHAAGVDWRPSRRRPLFLAGAYLAGLCWKGIRLRGLNISDADFSGAQI